MKYLYTFGVTLLTMLLCTLLITGMGYAFSYTWSNETAGGALLSDSEMLLARFIFGLMLTGVWFAAYHMTDFIMGSFKFFSSDEKIVRFKILKK